MNTGAEAVETAIKVARKWGYEVKGVPAGQADDRRGRGQLPRPHDHDRRLLRRPGRARRLRPVHPGLRDRCRTATSPRSRPRSTTTPSPCCSSRSRARRASWSRRTATCAGVRELCTSHNVLFVADEIQSGLGRTGAHVRVRARGRRARHVHAGQGARRRHRAGLGGGRRPRRARRAPARPARLDVRRQPAGLRGRPSRWSSCWRPASSSARSAELGVRLHERLRRAGRPRRGRRSAAAACGRASTSTRRSMTGREVCERLMARGVLAKDTHGSTIRLAPPLVITRRTWTGVSTSSPRSSAAEGGLGGDQRRAASRR